MGARELGAWVKSRGTSYNPANRYHSEVVVPDEPLRRAPETQVTRQRSGRILATNASPDVPFEQSINPYRGCEHGCVYCFARPTHAYLDHSPGIDFETRLYAKIDAAQRLRETFERPSYQCKVIGLGTNTDPYQPLEREEGLTRQILEVCLDYGNPVSIVTKGHLVLRDIDLLAEMARRNLVSVALSVTTLDNHLKRLMEPRASSPEARLRTLEALNGAGIPTSVLVAPIIPRINDQEIEGILERVAACGTRSAGYVMLRLPLEVRELFENWLEEHYPDRRAAVMNAMRSMHDGQAYRSLYGVRQRGTGHLSAIIARRFDAAKRRYGVDREAARLDTGRFRRIDGDRQLRLFG